MLNAKNINLDEIKPIFAKYSILIVEDDATILKHFQEVLSFFFKKVYAATNGEEAYALYKEHKTEISILLSDYNMPKMTGLELFKKIRRYDKSVILMLLTGEMSKELFSDAIKVKLNEFVLKPVQLKTFLVLLYQTLLTIEQEKVIQKQNKELKTIFSLLEKHNLVTKTDLKGNITYANKNFCDVSGYTKDEIMGKPHNIIRHPDTPKAVFKEMWQTIQSGNIWRGRIKNQSSDGSSYIVNAMIMPVLDSMGNVKEYISSRHLITQEITEHEKVQEFNRYLKKNLINLKSKSIKTIRDTHSSKLDIENEIIKEYEEKYKTLMEQTTLIKDKNKMLLSTLNLREKELQDVLIKHDKVYDLHREKIDIEISKTKVAHQQVIKIKALYNDILIEKNELEKALETVKFELGKYQSRVKELEDVVYHYDMNKVTRR